MKCFFFEKGGPITIYSDQGRLKRIFFIPVILNMHAYKRLILFNFKWNISNVYFLQCVFLFLSSCNEQYPW